MYGEIESATFLLVLVDVHVIHWKEHLVIYIIFLCFFFFIFFLGFIDSHIRDELEFVILTIFNFLDTHQG